jgi:small ligand-binding sensory domain FIST
MAENIEFVSAASRERDARKATRDVLSLIEKELDGRAIDLALLFVSSGFTSQAAIAANEIRSALAPNVFAGCSAEGVIGDGEEIESTHAISLIVARLPGAVIDSRPLRGADIKRSIAGSGGALDGIEFPDDARLVILSADPYTTPMDSLLAAFNDRFRGLPVVGGMASAVATFGGNVLLSQEEVLRDGAVMTIFSGAIEADVLVSQGCRPVGRVFRVSDSRGNVILGLENSAPLEELRRLVEELPGEDRELLRNGIFLGRAIDPRKDPLGRGDFLVRGVIGVDPRTGAITVGDLFDRGDVVQFHLRDARTATEDLELMLSPHTFFGSPKGALLFSCNGRGTRLYDHPHGDVSVIKKFFPGVSVAGHFCAGEIGPVGGRNFLHGHTATLALFRSPERPVRPARPLQ